MIYFIDQIDEAQDNLVTFYGPNIKKHEQNLSNFYKCICATKYVLDLLVLACTCKCHCYEYVPL